MPSPEPPGPAGPRRARTFLAAGRRALAALALAAILLGGCAPKLIEWGWGEPDQAFLARHHGRMEEQPFDGLVLHLRLAGRPGPESAFLWDPFVSRYTPEEVAPAVETLRGIPFRRFRHNFLRVNLNRAGDPAGRPMADPPLGAPLDLFDDPAWEMATANLALAARVAREAGLAGLLIDPEAYAAPEEGGDRPRFNAFDYTRRGRPEASFADYQAQAFRRGLAMAEAIGAAHPSLVLFLAFAYTGSCLSTRPEPERSYALLPAFVDGLLEGKAPGMEIVDGFEPAYAYRACGEFQRGARRFREECRRLSRVPWRFGEVRLAFGLWMDYESGRVCAPFRARREPCPWADGERYPEDRRSLVDPARFGEGLAAALDLTDGFVWVYSEEPRWWTEASPGGENLPAAFVEAIRAARHRLGQGPGRACKREGDP